MENQTDQNPSSSSETPRWQPKFITMGVLFLLVLGAAIFTWQTHPSPQLSSQLSSATPPSVVPSASPLLLPGETPIDTPFFLDSGTCSVVLNFQPLKDSDSTATGFAFSSSKGMYMISVDPAQPHSAKLEDGTDGSVGTVGLGESGVATSPDGKYVAYQTKDNRLVLLTSDNKQKVTLPPQLKVSGVGPWSPDSHRLIVFSAPGTVSELFEGMGEPEGEVSFKKGLLPKGYYLIDIKAGTVIPLTPISSFTGWVDKSRILTSTSESNIDNENLIVFDVDRFTVDTTNLLASVHFFSVQKTVSDDGKKWALTVWPTGKDVGDIYTFIADFPQLSGSVIAKSIRTQEPIISPNGESVMFRTYDELNGPNFVEYWQNDKLTRVGKGVPLRWVDKTHFIYAEMTEEHSSNTTAHLKNVVLYDLTNGEKQELFGVK